MGISVKGWAAILADSQNGDIIVLSRTACSELWNKLPFSAFTKPLYLVFRGRWPDLAYGISGVWTFGPKLWFQLLPGR
jgi:hypothetical protein